MGSKQSTPTSDAQTNAKSRAHAAHKPDQHHPHNKPDNERRDQDGRHQVDKHKHNPRARDIDNRHDHNADDRSDRFANARGRFDTTAHGRHDDNEPHGTHTRSFDNHVAGDTPTHREDQHASGVAKTRRNIVDDAMSADLIAFAHGLAVENIQKGISLDKMVKLYPQLPDNAENQEPQDDNSIFMVERWQNDARNEEREPQPINAGQKYHDTWDKKHVHMPCSDHYILKKSKEPQWHQIILHISALREKCKTNKADFRDLQETIERCGRRHFDMTSLENLINNVYQEKERTIFMTAILPKICSLVLKLNQVFTEAPPLLSIGSNRSVTMSQRQAASLLACAFFCLFPYRSEHDKTPEYSTYPNPNFDRLYQKGSSEKVQKLKCILHYFERLSEHIPIGVITFRRFMLRGDQYPHWKDSRKELSELHMTTGRKIEEFNDTLQVDFANKYIGGGVLGSGCVQEEIRFSICPEMLVSLLLCEVMEDNECIFLTGCEQYSTYKGYAHSFEFDADHRDRTNRDRLGRKRCNLVAMDAVFFRAPAKQYEMKSIDRELIKAYTSFRRSDTIKELEYAIATGNWGCGAFNGDKQLKAIIQLMAASEAGRSIIYAAFGDKHLVNDLSATYEYLKNERATVGDLYGYLCRYARKQPQDSLFDYIRRKPVSSIRKEF